MKRNICFIIVFVIIVVSTFSQEKIRYGNIPYGISIEQAIERYKELYDSCEEETSSYSFNCTFIDFTALRPMFQNIFGVITTFRLGYTSAWTSFDKNFTKILSLGEKINEKNTIYTELYFLNNKGQTKLFMVSRGASIESTNDPARTYSTNRSAITERLGLNPRELSGTYDYYSSGSRSVDAFTDIWEENNERVVLYVADSYFNGGAGLLYISNTYWREYENLYIQKRNAEQNTAKDAAKNQF
jgi:hypothetical protein